MNGLALCAGVGGLELGVEIAIPGYRTVGYVERDAFAAATLVARMEEEALEPAPVWDDIESFDGRPWGGKVDLITAGFPCQPFSVAGKGLGTEDERWLWPDIERIVREVQPGWVFLENVPLLVRRGLWAVLGGLARLGYDARWDLFSAKECGAPHGRRRLFMVAQRISNPIRHLSERRPSPPPSTFSSYAVTRDVVEGVAQPPLGRQRELWQPPRGPGLPDRRDQRVADSWGQRLEGCGDAETALGGRQDQLPRVASSWPTPMAADDGDKMTPQSKISGLLGAARTWPTPTSMDSENLGSRTNDDNNAHSGTSLVDATCRSSLPALMISMCGPDCSIAHRRLNPRFVEWLMGWPIGWTAFGPVGTELSRFKRQSLSSLYWQISRR